MALSVEKIFRYKIEYPDNICNVVVNSVISIDGSSVIASYPHKKTITVDAAIYRHIKPNMQ